jgi:hypothetical protein
VSWFVLLWLVIVVGPVVAWLLFRSKGYKRELLEQPPLNWRPTGEAFEDPTLHVLVEVWSSPDGSERAYVRRPRG